MNKDIINEEFIKELELLKKEGVLAPSLVFKNNPETIIKAKQLFGSYIEALRVLGIDYEENTKGRKYTDRYLIEFLLDVSKREDFSPYFLQKEHNKIYKSICGRFFNLRNFFDVIGIDYDNSKQRNSWTKEKIKKELQLFFTNNDKNIKMLELENRSLYNALTWHFNSVKEAMEYSGLIYEEYLKYTELTKNDLKKFIKSKNKDELTFNFFQRNYPRYYSASIKYYGSYENAINDSGIKYEDVLGKKMWTKENIIEESIKYIHNGKFYSYKLRKNDRKLDNAIKRHFHNYEKLLKEIKLIRNEFENLILIDIDNSGWNKINIIESLIKLNSDGLNLNSLNMYNENRSLHRACKHHFGTYKKAVEFAGLDYKNIVRDKDSYFGLEFQKILGNIFKILDINFLENKEVNGLKPDFRLDNEIWIDAKLSQWTSSIDNTIKKYKDYCNELIIIYFRGYSDEIDREDNVKVISIYKYLNDLGINEESIIYEWLNIFKEEVEQ